MAEQRVQRRLAAILAADVVGYSLAGMEDPDITVTEYNMPQGSGDYLLFRLKSNLATRQTPAIGITGRKFGGAKDTAFERNVLGRRGAVAHLTKPLELEALVEVGKRLAAFATA